MRSRRLRAAAMTIGVTATLLSAACYAGCEAVPEIRFVGADAGEASRSDSPSGEGGTDASDGSAKDGADASSCTGSSPSAAALCCAPIWCEGDCNPANCDECAVKARSGMCQAGDVCCGKTGNVVCKRQCP